jgi:hypothetical protein
MSLKQTIFEGAFFTYGILPLFLGFATKLQIFFWGFLLMRRAKTAYVTTKLFFAGSIDPKNIAD